jgi:hypothetical protein
MDGRKKKIILASVAGAALLLVGLPLAVLFTPPGNYLLRPLVESKINKKSPIKVTVAEFRLTPWRVRLKADFGQKSFLLARGTYGMFSKEFDIDYTLHLDEFEALAPVLPPSLKPRGGIDAEGNVKGDPDRFVLSGTADIADGDAEYALTVADRKPEKASLKIRGLRCGKAQWMLSRPEILHGSIDADVELDSFSPGPPRGKIAVTMKNGSFDGALLKKLYGIEIPKDLSAEAALDAKLGAETADFSLKLDSSLAKCAAKGSARVKKRVCDLEYSVDVKELALLEPLIGRGMSGPLKIEGKASGPFDNLEISGDTDFGGGETRFKLALDGSKPASASFDTRGASLAAILRALREPVYADAVVDAKGDFSSLEKTRMAGTIHATLSKGKTFPDVLEKTTGRKNVAVSFDVAADTVVKDSVAATKADIHSNMADATAEKAVFDLNTGRFSSDYVVTVPDLDALYPFTQRHLTGGVKVEGTMLKEKGKEPVVTARSKTLGGEIEARLENGKIVKTLKGLSLVAICEMLQYPKVFDSKIDGAVDYDLKSKKGAFDIVALGGHVIPISIAEIIKRESKFDITKEVYKKSVVKGTIVDKTLTADINLASGHSSITSKKAKLYLADDTVDADVRFDIKKKPFNVKFKGPIRDPKMKFDVSELVIDELEKAIEKKVPKKHRKTIKTILDIFKK